MFGVHRDSSTTALGFNVLVHLGWDLDENDRLFIGMMG